MKFKKLLKGTLITVAALFIGLLILGAFASNQAKQADELELVEEAETDQIEQIEPSEGDLLMQEIEEAEAYAEAVKEEPGDEIEDAAEEEVEEVKAEASTWEEKVQEIASNDDNASGKFREIDMFAYKYEPTQDELKQFETDIINEFGNGNYLSDITNHEYMLENIFKSAVIQFYYDEGDNNPYHIDHFAFDFYQNMKYVYRGVDDVNSSSVKSNEDQMFKLLGEILIK